MLAPISVCMCAKLLQSYLPLCDSMNYSPPGSSVRGSLQARTLEWVATPSSRGSSPPKDQAHGSYISYVSRWVLYTSASWEGERAMAPHSSTVARKIPWMEEPGGLQSMGSLRVGHN